MARQLSAARVVNIADLRRLDVHTRDQHHVCPSEIGRARRLDVLIDEAGLPGCRERGRDHQQALRRHQGADAVHERIGVLEHAERRGVAREDAQTAPPARVIRTCHEIFPGGAWICASYKRFELSAAIAELGSESNVTRAHLIGGLPEL